MWGIDLETLCFIGLAAFRLTRLIVFDKITEFIRSPFFEVVEEEDGAYLVPASTGLRKWIGELLDCYWCTGIWVSAGLLFLYKFLPLGGEQIILIFAVAALASIVETVITKLIGN